jgi:predicted MPP superfamily phosphohydrolase
MDDVILKAVLVVSTLLDGVAAGSMLFGVPFRRQRDDRSITLGRAAWAMVSVAAIFVCKLPLWFTMGLNFFGIIHLAYLDLVVLLPIVGLALLLAGRSRGARPPIRRVSRPVRTLAWLSLLPLPIGMYATFVEPFRLQLETTSAPLAPEREGAAPIRIGVLADIQTSRVTDYERSAVERMMALAPDVIIMPGDLFQARDRSFEQQVPALRDLLSRLSAPGGVYFVIGNVDSPTCIERLCEGTSVRLLVNEIIHASVRDRQLTIAGLDLRRSREATRTVRELESLEGDDDVRLLIAHYPDRVFELSPDSRVDLMIAGHTHGGQVQIPSWGPLITLSGVPRRVAAGGLHILDGRRIYVSRGIGCERSQAPRIRLFCPPEISLVTMTTSSTR